MANSDIVFQEKYLLSFFYLFDVKQMQNNTIVGENKMCLRQAAWHDIHSYSKIKRCGCCVSIRKENIPHDTPPTQQKFDFNKIENNK